MDKKIKSLLWGMLPSLIGGALGLIVLLNRKRNGEEINENKPKKL
jgi:hypothetical protein